MIESFDVAIAGGGAAGSATAIALAEKGRSVLVIERSNHEGPRIGETLPPRARLPLLRLGVWERFIRARHLPSAGTLAAWGDDELAANDSLLNPYGCGWHLNRERFDGMLARRASQVGARVVRGARVLQCSREEERWRIESDAGVHWAKFLVDATGRAAWVARQLGVRRIRYDRLVGIVGFSGARAQDTRTLVEATHDGWWYSALLPGRQIVVAYMTDADLLPPRRSELGEFWQSRLTATRHIAPRLGDSAPGLPLRIFASNSFRQSRVAGEDWVAVGDAAHALDPLSSQGIYQALESGLCAGAAIDRCLSGNAGGLKEYAAWIGRRFSVYLEQRASFYEREERWREVPFWKRRQSGCPAVEDDPPRRCEGLTSTSGYS